MRDWVSEWVQEDQPYVWRYANPNRHWRGWHFTADRAGCRSIRNLLDRMNAGESCHRTLKLEKVTDAILSVPNYAQKTAGHFSKLRIEYRPEIEELRLSAEGELLTMMVGGRRLRKLSAAFAEVETGGGDFGIATSEERKADTWMFWWMPGINYHFGKRL